MEFCSVCGFGLKWRKDKKGKFCPACISSKFPSGDKYRYWMDRA